MLFKKKKKDVPGRVYGGICKVLRQTRQRVTLELFKYTPQCNQKPRFFFPYFSNKIW